MGDNLAKARKYSIRSPLEDACPLMSNSLRSCEFSTITSGTERERGFAGILPCRANLWLKYLIFLISCFKNYSSFHIQYLLFYTKASRRTLFLSCKIIFFFLYFKYHFSFFIIHLTMTAFFQLSK